MSVAVPNPQKEVTMLADHHVAAVNFAGRRIAAAILEHERAAGLLAAATAGHEKVAGRLYDLDRRRADIVARRAGGDQHPEDGSELALIQADAEGLSGILRDAETAVAAARAPVDVAQQAIAAARVFMADATRHAEADALVAHAEHLDGLLLTTLTRLEEARRGVGGRPPYGPSEPLRSALRRLSAARHEL